MLYTLLIILIVLVAILMIGIVLIQESKGGGLNSNFNAQNAIMGVRKTTDFIEKATWGLAIAMVVISVLCAWVAPTANSEQSVMEKSAIEAPATNPNNTPGFGASQQQAPAAQAAEGAVKQAEGAAKQAEGTAKQAETAPAASQKAPAAKQ